MNNLQEGDLIKRKDGAIYKIYCVLTTPPNPIDLVYIYQPNLTTPSGFQLTLITREELESQYTLIE